MENLSNIDCFECEKLKSRTNLKSLKVIDDLRISDDEVKDEINKLFMRLNEIDLETVRPIRSIISKLKIESLDEQHREDLQKILDLEEEVKKLRKELNSLRPK